MFINKDVFKYMTRNFSKKEETRRDGLEELFTNLDLYYKESATLDEEIKAMEKEGKTFDNCPELKEKRMRQFSIQNGIGFDRFEFLGRTALRYIERGFADHAFDEKTLKGIKKKLRQLYNLAYRMWNAQLVIHPSHGLAPQGGHWRNVDDMRKYHKKMISFYDKNQREREW
jgi:hypothetical protein